MKKHLLHTGVASDSGSALVITIAVAVIGMTFSLIVMTQAINVTNDAARDRVRTIEIHSAEAAIDATFRTLETSTPCETTMSVGDGSTAVEVSVAIEYFNDTGQLTCTSGVLSGVPDQAVLTSIALPANEMPGAVVPERRLQATINLVPILEPSLGVAMFSGGTMAVANNGTVVSLDPDDPARIWVENQDFNCSNNVVIDADLIVTDGRINISNSCRVTGSAWAKTGMSASNNAVPYRVGGDLVIYQGDLSNGNSQAYGGTVSVGGNIWGTFTAVGAVCSNNVGSPCPPLPLYTNRGLPTVPYEPSDWVGFTEKSKAQFAADVIAGAGLTGSNATSYAANPCAMTNKIKNPVVFTTTDSIYDLRTCSPLSTANVITFVINADTAFFVNGFTASNSFTVTSGDGLEHDVWFIVPTGYTGSINLSNSSNIVAPIHVFMFTPSTVTFANSQTMVGQAYGMNIFASNSLTFKYTPMGIPGVDLSDPTANTAPAGYSVEIVSKHEIRN